MPQNRDEIMRQVDKVAVDAAQKEVERILSEMKDTKVLQQPFSLGILGENFWSILTIVLVALWVAGVSTIPLWVSFCTVSVPIIISLGIHAIIKFATWRAKRQIEKLKR